MSVDVDGVGSVDIGSVDGVGAAGNIKDDSAASVEVTVDGVLSVVDARGSTGCADASLGLNVR